MAEYDRRHDRFEEASEPADGASDSDADAALEAVYVAQRALWAAVGRARELGLTWDDIGGRLGLSAETVHQRYAHWVPIDTPPEDQSKAG